MQLFILNIDFIPAIVRKQGAIEIKINIVSLTLDSILSPSCKKHH